MNNDALTVLFFLHFCTIFSMDDEAFKLRISDSDKALKLRTFIKKEESEHPLCKLPTTLITEHAKHPEFILTQLQKYPVQDLLDFHYTAYNNIFHCIVETIVQKKDSIENFEQLIKDYKPLFKWLVSMGLNINEVNDHHNSPLVIAYIAQNQHDQKLNTLIHFLENELDAKPSYFSIAPEMRFCKKLLWEFITCRCCKQKYS